MTVHVLMPVFNRLAMTQAMLACLRAQQVDESLSIVVIDDNSPDGTGQAVLDLQQQYPAVHLLHRPAKLGLGSATLAGLQNAGKPVALHFHADWCPTCVNQSRALNQLKATGQLQGVTVLVADYDKEKDLKRQHKVRSQSVLIIFKGKAEVARSAGETQPEALSLALAKAL